VLEYSANPPAETLRTARSNGSVPGNGSIGISTNPTAGGKLARAINRS